VLASLRSGARNVLGGGPRGGPGFFYEVALLSDVTPGMRVFDEETFGPVAALSRARDAEDALRLANHSQYGLGANVWTRDLELGNQLARRLEAGTVAINGFVKSDPRMPFGGIRQSGYGRELATIGIREFVNTKSVWVA
jgi:succinate-semialdehyde dehydrogenase/glutarate-semialdehyde dehydrogenase